MGESRAYQTFDEVYEAIRADGQNASYTERGIDPLYAVAADSRVVVIGQAPGRVAQDTRVPWNDKSGDRLRDWLGVDRDTFYDPHRVAIVPMDFYYPGRASRATCRLARASRRSGTRSFSP